MLHEIVLDRTWCGLSPETRRAQIAEARSRGYPEFDFDEDHVKEGSIAIIGGGPSLADNLHKTRGMTTMAVGSTHDYLLRHGVVPDYVVIADGGDIHPASYLRHYADQQNTTYLVATQCHHDVFETLARRAAKIVTWNAYNDPEDAKDGKLWILGGCTTALRALFIAHLMGYRDIHLFGMDSCYDGDESHAYKAAGYHASKIMEVETDDGRKFRCQPYHVAQALDFQNIMLGPAGDVLNVTIHGSGLIAHMSQLRNLRDAA